jgi:hypothetical protein
MRNWIIRFLNAIRDLSSRLYTRARRSLQRSREANVPRDLREICERYGEDVIGLTLASGHTPRANELRTIYATDETVEHARTWLTERTRSRQRRDRITFSLEIVVVLLIGGEIVLGLWQERLQSRNFEKQQQVLTNLQNSSAATANTLTALQRTAELTNTTLQEQLDAVRRSEAQAERSAKAGEASASTASQALRVSERAYVHMRAVLTKPPAVEEKLQISVSISNSGRTPAVELTPNCRGLISSGPPTPELGVEQARTAAFATPSLQTWQSVTTLAAGQATEVQMKMQQPLNQSQFDTLIEGKGWLYIFATVSYKDVFQQIHHTEICGIYEPALKIVQDCHAHNNSD